MQLLPNRKEADIYPTLGRESYFKKRSKSLRGNEEKLSQLFLQ
jgi:hypothetical protein